MISFYTDICLISSIFNGLGFDTLLLHNYVCLYQMHKKVYVVIDMPKSYLNASFKLEFFKLYCNLI